jgi:hypothetical protein
MVAMNTAVLPRRLSLSARRHLTTTTKSIPTSTLSTTLQSRQFPTLYEHLTPTSASKLAISLSSHLPPSYLPYLDSLSASSTPQSSTQDSLHLPPSFHLVYFNPALAESTLLPDGTDPAQSPGAPFVRRMWAGGSLHFSGTPVRLDGARHACVERISGVTVKGGPAEGQEKVFVTIERRIGREDGERDGQVRMRLAGEIGELGGAEVVEERNIVFLRERTGKELERAREAMATGSLKDGLHKVTASSHGETQRKGKVFVREWTCLRRGTKKRVC